jgi:hypothetical protein
MRKLALISLSLLLSLFISSSSALSEETTYSNSSIQGELPTYEVGDQWVAKLTLGKLEYIVTQEVIEKNDCYILKALYKPPFMGIVSSTIETPKNIPSFPIRTEITGREGFKGVIECRYEFLDVSFWPLEVGKEVKVIEALKQTTIWGGKKNVENKKNTHIYKVEAIEEVSVPAGTFNCFRITESHEEGETLRIGWYSDKAKVEVKSIDYEIGVAAELTSYHLV